MVIRPVCDSDIIECSKLFIDVFSGNPWNEIWEFKRAVARLTHIYKSNGFVGLVAETDGVISGFVAGTTEPFRLYDIFYLREMCVASCMQRNGIGEQLYRELEKRLQEKEVGSVYLATRCDIAASVFYQKIGFKISENTGFYSKKVF